MKSNPLFSINRNFSVFTGVLLILLVPYSARAQDMEDSVTYETVIVGGGIAGLTSAYYLHGKQTIKVLEKTTRPGGRTLAGAHRGIFYAKGTEYLGYPEKHLRKMIKTLGLQLIEIPSPMDAVYEESVYYYGEEGVAKYYIERSSVDEFNRFVYELQKIGKLLKKADETNLPESLKAYDQMSAGDWIRSHKFSEVYYNRLNVASRGLFGANLEEISALCLFPEMVYEVEDYKKLNAQKALALNTQPVYGEKTGAYSFEKGIVEVPMGLRDYLGDEVQLNSDVQKITKQGEIYSIDYLNMVTGKSERIFTRNVILAVPAPIAIMIAEEVLDSARLDDLNKIKYTSYATISFFTNLPVMEKTFDLTVPDDYFFTDIYDATWVAKKGTDKYANSASHIITIYIGPKNGLSENFHKMNDMQIMSKVYEDLENIIPGIKIKVRGYDVERFSYAYPLFDKGSYARLVRMNKSNTGSLILAGDYMQYPTFEAAVETGYIAAMKTLGKW